MLILIYVHGKENSRALYEKQKWTYKEARPF